MVEKIREKVRAVSLSSYGPWIVVGIIVFCVILTAWRSSPPELVSYPADTRAPEYWKTEMKLRVQIDRNLEETKELLLRLVDEMDRENYSGEKLLAQIKQKRLELRKLMEEMEGLARRIAAHHEYRYAGTEQ